jgi:hypothetical protein
MKLPQLSLRELFLLVVIAAMGCGWWVDHRSQRELNRKLSAQLLQAYFSAAKAIAAQRPKMSSGFVIP